MQAHGPLAGVRVLDLSRLLPGPFATLILADLGADVVKVEDTGAGDYLRDLPGVSPAMPGEDGQGQPEPGGMFAALNRGKRSIAIDLKKPTGAAVFKQLCARADVIVEGFRPGVMARLGLDPEQLCKEFPRLIVCSLSGFGQTGPWREKAGHDIGYLALSGALARNGSTPDAAPQLPGVQLADVMGGAQTAALAVLAALLERHQTGRGRTVDVSMTEGAATFLLPYLGTIAAGQAPQVRGEDPLSGSFPFYRVYRCKGSGSVALGALETKFWASFCRAVEKPEWIARQLDLGLSAELDAFFLTRTREEWTQLLEGADCCFEPVLEPQELAGHPLHEARNLFVQSGKMRLMRTQPALVATDRLPRTKAPRQGEHRAEVLRDYGIDPASDCG